MSAVDVSIAEVLFDVVLLVFVIVVIGGETFDSSPKSGLEQTANLVVLIFIVIIIVKARLHKLVHLSLIGALATAA